MAHDNVNDLCDDLQSELKHIHDLSDYIVDGQHCALKICYHEQNEVVHQLDVKQNENQNHSTFF